MRSRRKYRPKNPKWIAAKFKSTCSCGQPINRGEEVLWCWWEKRVYCQACAIEIDNGHKAELSYERFGTDCAYDQ